MTQYECMNRTAPDFDARWREFVAREGASWRYEGSHLEYYRSAFGKNLVDDRSFAVLSEGAVAAIAPLFLIERDGVRTFSLNGDFLPAPYVTPGMGKHQYGSVQKAVYAEVDRQAAVCGAQAVRFRTDALCRTDSFNVLRKFGYIDCSSVTSVLDLSLPLDGLKADLRKSYKAIINKGRRSYSLEVVDHAAADAALFDDYRQLHFKAAGRRTRPDKSYAMQRASVAGDKAVLFGLKSGGATVACAYFLHHGGTAFYGSYADDPDFSGPVPVGHVLLWEAIRYYHGRGFSRVELGMQQFTPQLFETPSEKGVNISLYKRGFGGDLVPMYQGVKYRDPDLLRSEIGQAAEELCRAVAGGRRK